MKDESESSVVKEKKEEEEEYDDEVEDDDDSNGSEDNDNEEDDEDYGSMGMDMDMGMGMGFDRFGSASGDAFLADGGVNFFRDRKISRKSMMYKDTWWTTLRPAKMESMPITSLLPEDNAGSNPEEDAEGNDEAIPGFDENITAVPSMATELDGDDDEQSSSLPLI